MDLALVLPEFLEKIDDSGPAAFIAGFVVARQFIETHTKLLPLLTVVECLRLCVEKDAMNLELISP